MRARMVAPVAREVTPEIARDTVGGDALDARPGATAVSSRRVPRIVAALGDVAVVGIGVALVLVRGDARPVVSQSVAVLPLSTSADPGWARDINDAVTQRLVEHLTNAESPRDESSSGHDARLHGRFATTYRARSGARSRLCDVGQCA